MTPQILTDDREQSMQEETRTLLTVRNLKTYFFQDEGLVKAVDGASFEVRMGQTVGIVGESGCGKSITAKSILGLIEKPGRIVHGEICYRREFGSDRESEIDLTKLSPDGKEMRSIRGREIALIFQEPMTSFSPVHPIGSQIIEAIMVHKRVNHRGARALSLELLSRVGIPLPEQRMQEYPHQLSGGLRQRAMIAMALSCGPKLLIADEPTTAVDVTTQAQILDLLKSLQQASGMAIIFITHNLGVIAEIADEVVVMYLGQVVEKAQVDDLFYAPRHPYTQALLRSIPSIRSVRRKELPSIMGSVPHPYHRPTGCPFHPRCASFMQGVCDERAPQLLPITARQHVSCFLYERN